MARPNLMLVEPALPPATATLASVCERAGDDLLEVVLAPHGLEVPVAGVCIHDPLDAARGVAGRGDLVLAPGAPAREQATDDLLAAVRSAGAAAVVVRRRRQLSRWLLEAFDDAGVALLTTPPELPWGELHLLLLAALDAGGERPVAGGLDGLADTTAALAGGPVTIEDLEGRLLAFSEGGQDIDAARAETVLGRCVPDRWLRELRRRGVIDRLVRSREAVRVDLPGLAPRRAVAIRGAATTLGVIWLAGDTVSAAADDVLRDAALAAAAQLTRDRAGDDLERRMRAGALGMLLAGEGALAPMLRTLGLPPDGEFAVVAVRDAGAAGDRELQRHADLLRAHLCAERLAAAGDVLDGRVYALVALSAATAEATLRRAVADFLQRSSSPLRAGLGEPTTHHGFADARRAADRCIELAGRPGELVAYDDIHGLALLADVARLVATGGAASPALRALRAYDGDRGTDYVATLRAFLDVHGDAGRTAATLGIHVNTLRYRLRRLAEISRLDLDDPEARLAVALELHAVGQRRAAPGVTSPIS